MREKGTIAIGRNERACGLLPTCRGGYYTERNESDEILCAVCLDRGRIDSLKIYILNAHFRMCEEQANSSASRKREKNKHHTIITCLFCHLNGVFFVFHLHCRGTSIVCLFVSHLSNRLGHIQLKNVIFCHHTHKEIKRKVI